LVRRYVKFEQELFHQETKLEFFRTIYPLMKLINHLSSTTWFFSNIRSFIGWNSTWV